MADRGIIFSAGMVDALLQGRKTQTRRLATSPLARAQLGDRLWVRETWCHGDPGTADPFLYRATYLGGANHRWTPSLHMPRRASRLTLLVTEVRRMPLHDLTRGDALAEGIYRVGGGTLRWERYAAAAGLEANTPEGAFCLLWNSLHSGEATWEAGPEVVALSFDVTRANIDAVF